MKPLTTRISAVALAAIAAAAALSGCGGIQAKHPLSGEDIQTYAAMTMPLAAAERTAAQALPAKHMTIMIKTAEEQGKMGPEGEWHDAFLPARFTALPDQQVTVTVYNYDEGEHSFTSPELGLNVTFKGGSPKTPHKTTFTFVAPKQAGRYEWFCIYPCDPWSMKNMGYMHGYVTVAA